MNEVGAIWILSLGFGLGLKHALDADHLVAVSTIVSERKGFWSASLVGVLWGLGHTASLLVVGLLVVAFRLHIPDRVALGMEFAVALMLIALGAQVLWKLHKGATFHVHLHEHDHRLHIHPHLHAPAGSPSGEEAGHHRLQGGRKPLLVGLVHGLAGSAALMLIVLSTIASRTLALVYIGVFGIGSIGGMLLMSTLIGLPFRLTARSRRVNAIVRTTAGLVSLCFGLFLAYRIGFVDGLFF